MKREYPVGYLTRTHRFIRRPEEEGGKLEHICSRKKSPLAITETVLVGEVFFNYVEGIYSCRECKTTLEAESVWQDNQGTGWEGHA